MKRQTIFAPLARLEFEDAVAWYNEQRPGLGEEFRMEVNRTLQQILHSPERFRLTTRITHKAVLHRFPYSLYYSIELDAINVASVFHGARNPEELRKRLK
ncbi:MAG: type II toxin-antitoxin system RelE/ParE family toxin [Limisphaerales bacterium]